MLSPNDVVRLGFEAHSGLPCCNKAHPSENDKLLFQKHCGSSHVALAFMWSDIVTNDDDTMFKLKDADKTHKGFKEHVMAMNFLWSCPKNAHLLGFSSQGKKMKN